MSIAEIEKRLTALEQDIARLKEPRPSSRKIPPIQTLEQIHGTFENDESFQQAVRLGRQWRKGERSGTAKSRTKRA
jgi:hypothetical protein